MSLVCHAQLPRLIILFLDGKNKCILGTLCHEVHLSPIDPYAMRET